MRLLGAMIGAMMLFGAMPESAQAQSVRELQIPAEVPPSTYRARQYVDTRGCVYVRAGTPSNVVWVLRVTRNRQPFCGYKPTFELFPELRQQSFIESLDGENRMAFTADRNPPVGTVVTAEDHLAPGVRVVPRHVYENRTEVTPMRLPKGYKPVWEDGRLNPHRANQTLDGHRAMRRLWTNTVPMRQYRPAD